MGERKEKELKGDMSNMPVKYKKSNFERAIENPQIFSFENMNIDDDLLLAVGKAVAVYQMFEANLVQLICMYEFQELYKDKKKNKKLIDKGYQKYNTLHNGKMQNLTTLARKYDIFSDYIFDEFNEQKEKRNEIIHHLFKKLAMLNPEFRINTQLNIENIETFIYNVKVENELLINKIKEKKAELEKCQNSFINEEFAKKDDGGKSA